MIYLVYLHPENSYLYISGLDYKIILEQFLLERERVNLIFILDMNKKLFLFKAKDYDRHCAKLCARHGILGIDPVFASESPIRLWYNKMAL